ncbi:Alpha/Beta hydrolase protein [Panaeolus papilionaceus]|nr:Alpha/Beta hydrolase protein [Panaeolus papilionaceus]
MPTDNVSEGKIDFKVGNETYQTWYKIYGDLKNSTHRPVVAVHGGPGMSHHYMLPHKSLFLQSGIPVVFYDQIGNGQSSHCPDVSKEFWTPELFMDELDNLLKALDIYDNFDLLGQSWGGMLGGQYAATKTPKGLKRLIIANSPASIALNTQGTDYLLNQFPKAFVDMVHKHEREGTTSSEEYQAACMKFYMKHYPTLLISSPLDSIQEVACLPFFTQIPKVKWVQLQNSTHLAVFEEPKRYFQVILDFLKETEVLVQ